MGPAFGRESDSVHPSVRPQLRSRPQYHLRSLRQYLRSLRGFDDIRHGWDPGPHRLCLKGELGGPGPPSGPAHRAQASHLPPDLSHHHSPEYVHASLREIAGVMDAICALAATQAAQDQRLAQCYSMLQQIMTHLSLPRVPDQREEPTTDAASLDVLAAAAAASDPPPPQQ